MCTNRSFECRVRTLSKCVLWTLSLVRDGKLYEVIVPALEDNTWCVNTFQTPAFLPAVLQVTPWALLLTKKLGVPWGTAVSLMVLVLQGPDWEPTWLPVTSPCPWAQPRLDSGWGGLPVSCPACGMMRLGNVPGPGSTGHLGESCSSGRASRVPAWCELQHPELLKRSFYSKARVKVLNGSCFDHSFNWDNSHWALTIRVSRFSFLSWIEAICSY